MTPGRHLPFQRVPVIRAQLNFVEVTPSFPDECRYALETLRDVYAHDAQARAEQLTPGSHFIRPTAAP